MNNEESSDLVGQRKIRIEKVNKLRELGFDPYPAKSNRTHLAGDIKNNFENLENETVTVAGRLMSWREHGALIFGDLQEQSGSIQLYIRQDELGDANVESGNLGFDNLNLVDIGDIIEVTGYVTKTKRGEISVAPKEIRVLEKSIRPIPTDMEDKEERFRRRYVDMVVHPEVRARYERRAAFWQAHRDFFNERGFFEVNIPILEHIPGGGDAVPFKTHMNAINEDFYLRISHELPLKRLIGGGFEKVYDVGARFRNEGLSDEHLPEHVAMEFYWAYADWRDGMQMIQDLFKYVIDKVYEGKHIFNIRGFEIDFSKDWEEIDFNSIMKERFGIEDVYAVSLEEVVRLLKENNIEFDEKTISVPRGIDSLWKQVRKTIAGPAFLVNHPKYLSPLQKPSLKNPDMVERFQPIIAGSELGNGWSEVNDAIDQYERFIEQQDLRDSGDDEAQWLDIDYVEMLEYGMPPTFGYGHSERVFWFLEDVTAREGVPFPQLKYSVSDTTKKIYPEVDLDDIKS
ncbi:lysine--tRNA ligase [Candidatus Dojkabacteria bacterium]|uniref:Lysine--tRNA ligase n=1 Tax=Candidatus Dojkabacteria bacterium TaxID=2099670 RepID=A0A955IFB4_9BACT|nr:lysine--tRNA ligase [Candidatus Dojkabacteria bacterium]